MNSLTTVGRLVSPLRRAVVHCLVFVSILETGRLLTASLDSSCTSAPSGLVGWWQAEGNANDSVGTNNGVLLVGATANAPGMVGSAFSFDGTNGAVQIADSPSLRPANLSVEAWVKFNSLDSEGTSSGGQQFLVFKKNSRTTDFEGYNLSKDRRTQGDYLLFGVTSANGVAFEVDTTTLVTTGVWYHVVGIRGPDFLQIYLNGVLENSVPVNLPQDYGDRPVFFGSSGESYWDHKLKGLLDEVSIYNRALTSNEVSSLYAAAAAGKCRPVVFTSQPKSQTVRVGTDVTLSATASGTAPLLYQWLRNGAALADGGNLSGSSTATLNLTNAQTTDSGSYQVTVANVAGSVSSAVANLSVRNPEDLLPHLVNLPATNVQATLATINGQITDIGIDTPVVTIFYGPADGGANESAWANSLVLGLQTNAFGQTLTGLAPGTTIYFSSRAVNSQGTKWAASSLALTTTTSNTPSTAAGVFIHHNDPSHTGSNLHETLLNTNNVNTNQFGLLYTLPVDDQVYAQPLVATNVNVFARATHNLLIVATVNDSVYAFDADDPKNTAPYWKTSFLGPNSVPPTFADAGNCETFSGNLGIVGTPVIDPAGGTIYLVARTKEYETNFVQRLHALDLTTGAERPNSPVVITAQCPGNNTLDSVGGIVTFDPLNQNQRPGLLLVNGLVYIAWASQCDIEPYHGWLMAYDENTLQQVAVFITTPDGREGGIWMSGQGPSADTDGNVYVSLANGPEGNRTNPQTPGYLTESVLKLSLSGRNLTVASSFTPYNWEYMEDNDDDLGSSGVLLIPGTNLAITGSKLGKAYVLDRNNMGGLSQDNDDTNIVQSFQVTTVSGFYNLHGAPVWWDGPNGSFIYIQGAADTLHQYQFNWSDGAFIQPDFAEGPTAAPFDGLPGGILAVSANGTNAGSGIVWASHQFSGDAETSTRPGILHAYGAQDVSHELWNSEQLGTRDSVGSFAKFCPPVVANGRVYLATFSNRVNVYGLLSSLIASNPAPVVLNLQLIANQIQLTWSAGMLQTSVHADGPYTNLPSATSPFIIPPSEAARFFRVKVH
jgi:hypothetical protein